ncbi:PREDICTED: O-acyltransferase WSD1-like isoform X3 [Ipomoea nil]|uniref:O-acyltransferase WSD1-like isoform X3 n=1 Tax=Ipomoea nil TaxID=35883 RepID=UPI000901CA51|nr:PREDICTED: O-acyltransferase WSD1-like isoform X3 [Ipomoea nil]
MECYLEGDDEVVLAPASPCSQYMNSSALSISNIAVLETSIPIKDDDSVILSQIRDVFLPINPRFSSIMVTGKNGEKNWKPVKVILEDHLKVPIFPVGKPLEFYDYCLSEYLTKISMDPFPQTQPLWEIHIFRYPTSNAGGNYIFKLHQSLGDGYSLMGALLSCLQRADNPALPLTFPRRQGSGKKQGENSNAVARAFKAVPRLLSGVVDTVTDFSWNFLKSSLLDDDKTAIHSQDDGVEFRPISVTTMTFSLYHLKLIKSSLNVTINDVISGIVTYGTRLYMQENERETCNGECTALVLFNTRAMGGGYKSVSEMIKPNAEMPWGNRITFLPFAIPKLRSPGDGDSSNPLRFIYNAHRMVKRQRYSASLYLTGQFLEFTRKLRGLEATAQFLRRTLKNTSITMTNIIGPVEETTLCNHPIKGMYFAVSGAPQVHIHTSFMLIFYIYRKWHICFH